MCRSAVLLVAALALAASGRPLVRLDEVVKDLGEVPSNRRVEVRWTLHNDGPAPLEIASISASCACLSARASVTRVQPGGEATIVGTFDPVGLVGEKRESISIRTDGASRGEIFAVLRARVVPPVLEGLPAGHPATSGQNYLMGSCGACHAAPASGKSGAELYAAVCAMCHGSAGEGRLAPPLRLARARQEDELSSAIALGTADPRMPGFSTEMAGPLSPEQIASLARLLESWAAGS